MNAFTAHHAPTIWVTLSYIALYYVFLINILRVKRRVAAQCRATGERYDRYASRHPEMLAADRVQLNMLEHMPPFLVLLWLQSLLVSPQSAAVLGSIYLLLRASYPVFLGSTLKRDIPRRLLLNTFAGYAVLTIFAGWQVASLLG